MLIGRPVALLCLFLLAAGRPAAAQSQASDPWEQGRFRVGPVAFTPSFVLKNLGWDSNVFNEAEDPKGDFTATGGGLVNWWLRAGDLRLAGSDGLDGIYYANFASERGWNHKHDLRVEYRFNRVQPYATGSYASIKDRTGYEIDVRTRHTETGFGAGFGIRLAGKTYADLAARKTTTVYDDVVYEGQSLAQNLNRDDSFGSASLRHVLTPLTTLTLLGEYRQERYDEANLRDNDSFRILPGVQFDPFALLKGSARVGYRQFRPLSPELPDFDGVVAEVDLSYVLLGRTRFGVGVYRDIEASYESAQPFYVRTGVTASIRQGVGGGWDVEVRGASQRLTYLAATTLDEDLPERVDRVTSYGVGVGYKLGQGTRVGMYVDYSERRSEYRNAYEGLRYGISAAYEF